MPRTSIAVLGTAHYFADVTQSVADHFADARRATILARFAAGDAVHLIRYESGSAYMVDQLARRLCVDRSGLMRIARTAERIRAAERTTMLALVDDRGWPLTWSHFSALACVPSRSARTRLARASVNDRLSVKDLRTLIVRETISQSSRMESSKRRQDEGYQR